MPFDSRSLVSLSNIHKQNGAPAEKPKGVSIYYLRTHFLTDIEESGKSRDSKFSEIEDITSDEYGPIRSKTAFTLCPRDGQTGVAYVDCLSDHPDHVGPADFLFSSSWECKVGDIVDELDSLCHANHLDEKRTYAWIWPLCHNHHRARVCIEEKAGDSDTVLVELMDALDIRCKAFGPDHEDTAMYHSNVGEIYKATGDYDGAFSEHQRALNIHLKVHGPDHPDTIKSHINIGTVYYEKGDQDGAYIEFRKALDICWKVYGPGHPEECNSQNVFFARLLELQNAVKDLKLCGPDHPHAAEARYNIGLVYKAKGHYLDAIAEFQRALAICLKVLGPDHRLTANIYFNIGLVNVCMGAYDNSALTKLQKALNIRLKVLRPDHPDVAESHTFIGVVFDKKGDYNRALVEYQKALDIYLKVLEPDHPHTAHVYYSIGIACHNRGNYDRALIEYQKALNIYLTVHAPRHLDAADSYNNIGLVYKAKDDYNRAFVQLQKAWSIYSMVLGLDHPKTAATQKLIGTVSHQLSVST